MNNYRDFSKALMVIDVSSMVLVTKVCNVPTNEFIESKFIDERRINLKDKIMSFYLIKYRHCVLRFFDIHYFRRIVRSVHRKLMAYVVIREMIDLE
jgi:hypothetical protein